jgi:hypothetical protein
VTGAETSGPPGESWKLPSELQEVDALSRAELRSLRAWLLELRRMDLSGWEPLFTPTRDPFTDGPHPVD